MESKVADFTLRIRHVWFICYEMATLSHYLILISLIKLIEEKKEE